MKTVLIFIGLIVLAFCAVGIVAAAMVWLTPSESMAERWTIVMKFVGSFAIGATCVDLARRIGSK